jgi:hypothetical protein
MKLAPDDWMIVQDEMIQLLQDAGVNVNLIHQENAAGKTLQVIREERKNKWLGKSA